MLSSGMVGLPVAVGVVVAIRPLLDSRGLARVAGPLPTPTHPPGCEDGEGTNLLSGRSAGRRLHQMQFGPSIRE